MKKVLLTFIASLAISTVTFAQKVDVDAIKAGIEKAKEATQNSKKATKGATWISLAEELNKAATAASSSIFPGMAEKEIILILGNPGKEGEYAIEKINDVEYKKFVYPMIDLYIADEKLSFWNETQTIYPDALNEAYAAYKKAIEVDPKSSKKVETGLKVLLNNIVTTANNNYMLNNYTVASKLFNEAAEVGSNPLVAAENAKMYRYYAGVSAVQGNDFKNALPIFNKLVEENHLENGDTYYYLGFAYEKEGDNDAAEAAYTKGLEAFSTNQKLLNQLINFYLIVKNDPVKVISLIKKAQEVNPDNPLMIFIEGVAYQNMKDYEKAHVAYNRVKEMDPDYFDAYYNDALVYIAEADSKVEELSKTDATNRTLQDKIMDEYFSVLKETVTVLEKALTIKPENRDVMDLIKSVSFRLRDEDPKYKELYDKYDALLK